MIVGSGESTRPVTLGANDFRLGQVGASVLLSLTSHVGWPLEVV